MPGKLFSIKKFVCFIGLLVSFSIVSAQEICTNSIDDDGDGLIDLNDPDCACNGISGGTTTPSSLIPNPSFEANNCCPGSFSELNCATSWIQASDATSDYLNTCGYISGAVQNTASLWPLPDGNGILGAWVLQDYMEFVGACLTAPMVAGQSYTVQMSVAVAAADGMLDYCGPLNNFTPMQLGIYGASCADLPFSGYTCPPAPWTLMGTVTYTPVENWQTITITFTPTASVGAIIIGNVCPLPADYPFNGTLCNGPYFLYDNILLNTSSSFNSSVSSNQSGQFATGDLTLTASSPTPGGTWQWYFNGIAIPGQTNSTLDLSFLPCGNGSGTYTAMYTIDTLCGTTSQVITIPDAPTASFSYLSNCTNTDVVFTGTSTPGTSPTLNYNWQFGDNQTGNTASPTHTYPSTGSYTAQLIITDANGCADTVSSLINVNSINAATQNSTICAGDSLLFFGQYYNANGTFTQTYTTAAGCDSTFTLNLTVNPVPVTNLADALCEGDSYSIGPYNFTAEGNYVVNLNSSNGCDSIVNLTLDIIPLPTASFTYSPGYVTVEENHVYFQDASVQSTSVFYTLGNGQSSSALNPDAVYPNEGEYTITQIAYNSLGCSDTTSLTLLVNPVSNYFIPNSFTPDNDGINDTWKISMTYIREYEVRIFDRWGEQLFHSDDLYNYWNGQVNNSGGKVKGDVYVYTIKVIDYLGKERSFRGNVNVVR